MAHRGSPVIISEIFHDNPRNRPQNILFFKQSALNLGAKWRWVVKAIPRPLYFLESFGTHCTGG